MDSILFIMPLDNELSLESLQEQLTAQAKTISDLALVNNQLKGRLAETSITTQEVAKIVLPTDPIEINGKKYKWLVPVFHIDGFGRTTAEEASIDDDILEAIVAIAGQGLLKEII